MATFLDLVNRTLELLRFDAVSSVSNAADPVTLVKNIVNRSARTVLEHRIWSFQIRDLQLLIPARVSASGLIIAADGSMAISSSDISTAAFGDSFTHWMFNVPGDQNFGETFFGITSFQTVLGSHIPTLDGIGTLSPLTAGSALPYELIPNIRKFPANVRQILSARHQEEPLEVVQWSRSDINAWMPDWHDYEGEPEAVVIGGTTSPTYDATLSGGIPNQTQSFGRRMLIWPAPIEETLLDLDVVWEHDVLSDDEDELSGVPERITDLIVLRSAVDGLLGQVVADVDRGRALAQRYEIELGRAVNSDQADPNRRRIPIAFGDNANLRDPNYRWERQTISGSWSWP